jgi:hypothetical protein
MCQLNCNRLLRYLLHHTQLLLPLRAKY